MTRPLFNPARDLGALRSGKAMTRAVLLVSQNCPACRETVGKLGLFPQLGRYVQVMDISRVSPEELTDPEIKRLVDHYFAHGASDGDHQRLDEGAADEPLFELPALIVDRAGAVTVYNKQHPVLERLMFERLTEYPA